jgi:hypothetical protein
MLPSLARLFETVGYLVRLGPTPRRVRVKTARTAALVAARGRPWPAPARDDGREQAVQTLAARWRERETWIAAVDEQRFALLTRREGVHRGAVVSRTTAALGELIADGATGSELEGYGRSQMIDPQSFAAALSALEQQLD